MNFTGQSENHETELESYNDQLENFKHEMMNEASIDADMNLLPVNKEKRCCWNCLKVLLEENSISRMYNEKIIKLKVVINKKIIIF